MGIVFNTVWSIVKPMVPPRALRKTVFLRREVALKALADAIGLENLEASYGGPIASPNFNDSRVLYDYIAFV